MTRKIGTYTCESNETDYHLIRVTLKPGFYPKYDDIITDDMIEEVKDPIWNDIVNILYYNYTHHGGKNHGEVAEDILELLKKEERESKMTDSGTYYKHDKGRNYNEVELSIVAKDGNRITLRLDKDLDVTEKVMEDLQAYHMALEFLHEGIVRGFITVNGEDLY